MQGAPGQQIDPGPLELSRTRAAQHKTQPVLLDETVHLVEQPRQPLLGLFGEQVDHLVVILS